jgi:NHL repeat
VWLLVLGVLVGSSVSAASARADSLHRFGFAFGGAGEGAGELGLVAPVLERLGQPGFALGGSGVAVDQATGGVYVADTSNHRVDEFTSKGVFVLAFGKDVNKGNALQPDVCRALEECQKGAEGSAPGELHAPRFIAVDNSGGASQGDMYVGDGVGSEAQNEIQFIEFGGASGGTFTLSIEGHTTAAIPFKRESPHGEDTANTTSALEAATGEPGAFHITQIQNEKSEVTGLEVEFGGALKESVTGLLACGGAGLVPGGSVCDVLLDRVGSVFVGEVVSKFSGEGVLEGSWGSGGQLDGSAAPAGAFRGDLNGITVDSAGMLWVYDFAEMYGFEGDGGFARDCRVGFGSASGLAPGVSPGEVYAVPAPPVQLHTNLCEGTEGVGTVLDSRFTPTGVAGGISGEGVLADLGGSVAEAAPGVAEPISFGPVVGGVGLGVGSGGEVFVASASEDKLDAFEVSLNAVTLAASEETAVSVRLNGEVDADGTEVVSCVFEYGVSDSYGARVPCEPAGPITGPGVVRVHVPVKGLLPGTVYHYRLRVVNKDGQALDTNNETFETTAAAVVEEPATLDVEPTSARLTAKVNPRGVTVTACEFEYGEGTGYGSRVACEPSSLGGGSAPVGVSAQLSGLEQGVEYHWRVMVADANTTVYGPDSTFVYLNKDTPPTVPGPCPNDAVRQESSIDPVTGSAISSELPDCRAYELVTPVDKNATLLTTVSEGPSVQVGGEGMRVMAYSLQCFAQSLSCPVVHGEFGAPYEFSREAGGWVTTALSPSASGVHEEYGQWGGSAQTGLALLSAAPEAGQASDTFYARQPDGTLEAIGPLSETLPYTELLTMQTEATADVSHVIFWDGSQEGLWPSLNGNGVPLYEYAGRGNGKPFLVDVEGGEGSTKLIGDCVKLAVLGEREAHAFLYALSGDGSIVYFEVCPGGEEDGGSGGGLYARIEGERPSEGEHLGARTVLVSGRAGGGGSGSGECSGVCASSRVSGTGLEGVSEDGSRVFFSSAQQLTNDASEDEEGEAVFGCAEVKGAGGCNLYMYENAAAAAAGGGGLVDVSAGDVSGVGPEVQGVMAVSADGSHVYFVAKGVLAGANGEGGAPMEGADNLYMYERDGAYPAGRTVFVTTLPGDSAAEQGEAPETFQWEVRTNKVANVTPDGDFLLFMSHGGLTGDATRGLGPEQAYRYDALTGSLVRVSIGERGFDDDGNAGSGNALIVAPDSKVGQPRRDPSMSDDGSVVVFQSPVALTARALNDVSVSGSDEGINLAQNIYEWDAPGTHGCEEPAGCIYLISDGQDATEAGGDFGVTNSSVELLGTDASGADVFFTTADRLVPGDTDSQLDFYDARVDGGFPAPKEPSRCATSETCHESVTEPAPEPSLGSSIFTGPGNPVSGFITPREEKPKAKTTEQVRIEKLDKALKACHKLKRHKRRSRCETAARKKYAKPAAHKATRKRHR